MTKIPVPMIAPIPSAIRLLGPKARFKLCSPVSCESLRMVSIDLVANRLAIRLPPLDCRVQACLKHNGIWNSQITDHLAVFDERERSRLRHGRPAHAGVQVQTWLRRLVGETSRLHSLPQDEQFREDQKLFPP